MENVSAPRIAVIEDNDDLREEVLFYLQHKNFPVWGAASAESFWKKLHFNLADIALVDLGLPDEDGFSVVENLRKLGTFGIVIITAHGSKEDRLRGLDLGADLFLIKPINFVQLVDALTQLGQRLEASAVETAVPSREPDTTRQPDKANQWQLDITAARLITPEGGIVHLTPKETELLGVLMESANQIFDRWMLHDILFRHAHEPDVHRIDVILSRVRKKARQQNVTLPLRSVFGKGVVFVME